MFTGNIFQVERLSCFTPGLAHSKKLAPSHIAFADLLAFDAGLPQARSWKLFAHMPLV